MGSLSTIGPYALEKRLGAGGMGEVYQAYDRRLERWVAIKLIRPESAEKATARERFRREARAAACLSHPSIVQIHDILETGDGDAIVMELVEGESLARRIQRGPLPVGEAVRIGREVAEGLAAAHAKGLIHRDLKPENVMITSGGRAKILDFGLAKRLEGEASLTEDHRLLGTFRSMSPEQAQGLPLDHRSDLFSFGTLLYEMLSGKSPFEGKSTLDTLTRICTHRQIPLREIDSRIPGEISKLVDQLLEKDPAHRPSSTRAVAVLETASGATAADLTLCEPEVPVPWSGQPRLVISPPVREQFSQSYTVARPVLLRWAVVAVLVAALAVALLWQVRRPDPAPVRKPESPVRVVIRRPEIGSGAGETAQILASSLRISLLRSLLGFAGISPLPPGEGDDVPGSPSQVARALAAQEILTSRLDCVRERCEIALQRVRGSDGQTLWSSRSFSVDADRPYLLEEAVQGYLADAYAGFERRAGARLPEVRPEDYTQYLRLRRAFEEKREGETLSPEDLIAGLAALRASSPQFLDAYAFEAEVRQQRYKTRQDPEDLDQAASLLQQAQQIAPTDPRPLTGQFGIAMLRGQWDRAEEALASLERLQPGDPSLLVSRARLLEKRGESEKALVLMREGASRYPSWRNLFRAAQMEFSQGHFAPARSYIEQLLANYPESYDGLTLLAQIEFLHGDLRRAESLYSQLVERYPRPLELSNLGMAQMYLGSYREAETSFRNALAQEPGNAFTLLNLADALSLQGKESASIYRQVVGEARLDTTDWQVLSARAQALAHLKDSPGAVEAVQKMIRIGPEGAQMACDTSLIYILLGDRNAALYNARQALKQGIEPRMFVLPWFDPLRADPAFAAETQPRARS